MKKNGNWQFHYLHQGDYFHFFFFFSRPVTKEIMFSGFCLFVFLSVKNIKCKRIAMQFYGGVWGGRRNKRLDFGSDFDHDPASMEVCTLRVLRIT